MISDTLEKNQKGHLHSCPFENLILYYLPFCMDDFAAKGER